MRDDTKHGYEAMNILIRVLLYLAQSYHEYFQRTSQKLQKQESEDTEAWTLCKDRNVLREYLHDREKNVVTIMMSLFDEEQIMRLYIKSERYEETKENALRLLKLGKISIDEVSDCFPDLIESDIKELEAEILQMI